MSRILLNVADIRPRSRVNGPGVRSVVWVQGCSLRCPGCFNAHTHPHEPRQLFEPQALAKRLLLLPDTSGITISGGEPFEQAEACAICAETIRAAGRTVMVFSGHTLEALRAPDCRAIGRFLAAIDLLVAGPYVERLKTDGRQWRASANQTLHWLTDRMALPPEQMHVDQPVVEVAVEGLHLHSTGFPDTTDRYWLEELLASVSYATNHRAGPKSSRIASARRSKE